MTIVLQEQAAKTSALINVTQNGRTATIQVSGTIDEQGAESLKERFGQLNQNGLSEVVFNFCGATYIGSAGLGKLLLFYKKLAAGNIKMRVETSPGTLRDILMELKLDSLFTIA